jgi:ubiquinone/menaquinone biosynthesis C-methylase UbiE
VSQDEDAWGWEPRWARQLYRVGAPVYDGMRKLWSSGAAERELDRLFATRIGSESRVLELGPGTGINVARLLRHAPDFRSYLGLDVSPHMLKRARRRAEGDPRVGFEIFDIGQLGRLEGDFDFVVCTWLLSHLDDPVDVVREALRRLTAGGTAAFLFFSEPPGSSGRLAMRAWLGVFRGRAAPLDAIAALPRLESLQRLTGGYAHLAVFH